MTNPADQTLNKRAPRKEAMLSRISLTTDEVHRVYGLTPAFLRRHQEIPRIKCGHRTIVYKVADIERFLNSRRVA
jgi:hypothetical protein